MKNNNAIVIAVLGKYVYNSIITPKKRKQKKNFNPNDQSRKI